jgi:hypothetical protein
MDLGTIRDKVIKPKLVDIFGVVIGNGLFARAISVGIKGKTDREKLQLMVNSICSDPKVVAMCGAAHAEKTRQEWLDLLT